MKSTLFLSLLALSNPFNTALADRIVRASAANPTSNFILDRVSGTKAAVYSLRQMTASYSGPAVTVRRASDSTTQDIGFSSTNFNTAQFNSFCASTTCFVAKWYDQSGNHNDAIQATAVNQPQIVTTGSPLNSKPSILSVADGITYLGVTDATSIQNMFSTNGMNISVISFVGTGTQVDRLWDKTEVSYRTPGAGNNLQLTQSASTSGGTWLINPAVTTGSHLIDITYSNSSSINIPSINYDSVAQGLTATAYVGTPVTDVGINLNLLGVSGSLARGFAGYCPEMIFFAGTVPNAADLSAIRSNEKAYYGTP